MPCQNGQCEIETRIRRQLEIKRTPDEIRYGQLWAEIELPKLLNQQENKKP